MGRKTKTHFKAKATQIEKTLARKVYLDLVGHRSTVGKSSAYGAKGSRFKTRWRQEFINVNCIVCSVH